MAPPASVRPAAPRRLGGLLVLLGLSLLLALAVQVWRWFDANFERGTETITIGYSAAARRNPWLAAERFLTAAGRDVVSSVGRDPLRALPPPTATLVVVGLGPLNPVRQAALQAWLTQGGHLIVEAMTITAASADPAPEDVLAGYGALLRTRPETDPPALRSGEALAETVVDGETLRVGFARPWFLEDLTGTAQALLAEGRPRVLHYPVGDGRLTVLSDTIFMTNADIGNHDHAAFLAHLTAHNQGSIWLLYDSTPTPLWLLLWQQAPAAISAALVLLLFLVWHWGARLGPMLPSPAPERRDLLLHLEAAAALVWRHGRGGAELDLSRRRVLLAWLRRHPGLRAQDARARANAIAARSGLPPAVVQRALYQPLPEPITASRLVEISRVLQQLWLLGRGQALVEAGADAAAEVGEERSSRG